MPITELRLLPSKSNKRKTCQIYERLESHGSRESSTDRFFSPRWCLYIPDLYAQISGLTPPLNLETHLCCLPGWQRIPAECGATPPLLEVYSNEKLGGLTRSAMALIDGGTNDSMIVVMGATGVGKSYFLNKLSSDSVEEGAGLHSSTLIEHSYIVFLQRNGIC